MPVFLLPGGGFRPPPLSGVQQVRGGVMGAVLSPASPAYLSPVPGIYDGGRQLGRGGIRAYVALGQPPATAAAFLPIGTTTALGDLPASGRIFNVTAGGTTGEILVTLNYSGLPSPTSLQYKLTEVGSGTVIADWTTFDNAPQPGKLCSITVPANTKSQAYNIQFRYGNVPAVTVASSSPVMVGALFMMDGQSNVAKMFSVVTGAGVANAGTRFYDHAASSWGTVVGRGAVYLANALNDALNMPVGLVVGRYDLISGTAISEHLDGTAIMTGNKAALAAVGGKVSLFYWGQGETNANLGTSIASYMTQLYQATNSVLATIRTAAVNGTSRANLPLSVGILGRTAAGNASDLQTENIRQAQRNTIANLADCFIGADCITVPLETDYLHYQPAGYELVAKWLTQAWLYAIGKASYGSGPRVVSASRVDSTTIDVVFAHVGGTDLAPTGATSAKGFEYLDATVPIVVNTALYLNATTYRLTLASPSTGPLEGCELRLMYGSDAGVNLAQTFPNAVTDNTAQGFAARGVSSLFLGGAASVLRAKAGGVYVPATVKVKVAGVYVAGTLKVKVNGVYA